MLITIDVQQKSVATGLGKSHKLLRFMRILRSVRLLRLLKLRKLFDELQDRISSEFIILGLGVVKLIVLIIAANHCIACAWHAIGNNPDDENIGWVEFYGLKRASVTYLYLSSLHWTLTQFTPASMEIYPTNANERGFAVIVVLLALVVFSSFVSSITALMTHMRHLSTETDRQFAVLRRFLRGRDISPPLCTRIKRFLDHIVRENKRKVQEADVKLLAMLSTPLQKELKREAYEPLLSQHPLFYHITARDSSAIDEVYHRALRQFSISQGDILFAKNTISEQMIFVLKGQLSYKCSKAEKILTRRKTKRLRADTGVLSVVGEGEWACEAALWTTWVHVGTLQALTVCDIVAVHKDDFAAVITTHKKVCELVQSYAENFVARLNEQTERGSLQTDIDSHGVKVEAVVATVFELEGPGASGLFDDSL